MLRLIALPLVCVGCGFESHEALDDASRLPAPGTDAEVDAAPDTVTSCFDPWMGAGPTFATPTQLTALSTDAADNRDPWVSTDERTMYFSRNPVGANGNDILIATRASITDEFVIGAPLANLNTTSSDGRATLTQDGLLLALASNREDDKFKIFLVQRNAGETDFPSPSSDLAGNSDTSNLDPFLSADGMRVYYSPLTTGSALLQRPILVASRTRRDEGFGQPAPVGIVTVPGVDDVDPALSLDERILLFTSSRTLGTKSDLWYATRAGLDQPFGAPQPLTALNTVDDDGDPMLSADGCTLYFASNRGGTRYQVFSAAVLR